FLYKKKIIDTKEKSINYCAIKIGKDKLKWPTLTELYKKLFNDTFIAHDSKSDVLATSKCFFELLRIGIISLNNINKKLLINKINLLKLNKINNLKLKINNFNIKNNNFNTKYFSHIHNHTSFSILSSTIDINSLIKKTIEYNMDAVGITDYGNMMGVFNFIKKIKNLNYNNKKIKPIIGCELFISYNYLIKKFTKKNTFIHYVLVGA
ncbi:DNA polymerase III, alpha subunit, partial [Snodgrassella alvi SCGC AB-598-P14]